jgi:hypothetical protein
MSCCQNRIADRQMALHQPVDRLEIREVVPDHENDFFGVIYTN